MAKIELREFSIMGVATHQFLVKYSDNNDMVELHGVAIFPNTGLYNGQAINKGNFLKVAAFPPIPSHQALTIQEFYGLFKEDQLTETLFNGTEQEVDARWNTAIKAAEILNARVDLKYELNGGGTDDYCAGNSNSVTATLEKIMGFTPHKINKNIFAPGLEKNLLSPEASAVYADLYNIAWETGGDYLPDQMDIIGKSGAATLTNMAEGNCIIS